MPTVSGGFFYYPDEAMYHRDTGYIILEFHNIILKVSYKRRSAIRTGPSGSDKARYGALSVIARVTGQAKPVRGAGGVRAERATAAGGCRTSGRLTNHGRGAYSPSRLVSAHGGSRMSPTIV